MASSASSRSPLSIPLNPPKDTTETDLYYLSPFDEKELKALEEKYEKSRKELEKLIGDYSKSYWYYNVENHGFKATEVAFFCGQVFFSNTGIQSFAHVAKIIGPNDVVSDSTAYAIGVPMAAIGLGFDVTTFSCDKAAAWSTLEYATRDSYQKRASDFYQLPFMEKAKSSVKFIANQSVLLTHNLTGIFADLYVFFNTIPMIPLPPLMDMMTAPEEVAFIAAMFYLGNGYYTRYSNPDYYEGLDFWTNGQPWLIEELLRGNIIIPLKIIEQGIISSVTLRSLTFYNLAVGAALYLGLWLPATLTVALVAIHSLCVRYPATYNRYMGKLIQAREAIKTEYAITTDKDVDAQKKRIEEEIQQENGSSFLIGKDMGAMFLVACQSLIGGFFIGYLGFVPLLTAYFAIQFSWTVAVLCAAVWATIVGGFSLYAENYRLMDDAVCKKLGVKSEKTEEAEENLQTDAKAEPEKPKKDGYSTSDLLADFLNFGSQTSRAMAVMGQAANVLSSGNSLGLGAAATLSVEQATNGFAFNLLKNRSTIGSYFDSRRRRAEQEEIRRSPQPT